MSGTAGEPVDGDRGHRLDGRPRTFGGHRRYPIGTPGDGRSGDGRGGSHIRMEASMHRRFAALAATLVLALSATGASAAAPPASRDATAATAVLDKTSAIVVLKQQPVATYDGHVAGYAKTKVSNGKLNPNSAAAKKYVGYLKTEHSAFAKWLQANVPSAKITSQYFVTLNAAAIGKLSNNADALTVEYNAPYPPDMSESYKLINAAGAWAAAGGRAGAG